MGDAIEIVLGAIPGRVPSKQRLSAWEAKRQADQVKGVLEYLVCELERSEPPREPMLAQVTHEAALRQILQGAKVEGAEPEHLKKLMQAHVTPTLTLLPTLSQHMHLPPPLTRRA